LELGLELGSEAKRGMEAQHLRLEGKVIFEGEFIVLYYWIGILMGVWMK
jgi:hypothetical protein